MDEQSEAIVTTRRYQPVATGIACAICIAIFIAINANGPSGAAEQLSRWGYVDADRIRSGAYWGFITSVFVHVQPMHAIFNVYWLWILGGAVERKWGTLPWLGFFLASAWISSGMQFLLGDSGIGMSGVGYALFGLAWIARTKYPEFRYVVTDRTAVIFLVWFAFCFWLNYTGSAQIGNLAHAGGLLFGVAVGIRITRPQAHAMVSAWITILLVLSIKSLFGPPLFK